MDELTLLKSLDPADGTVDESRARADLGRILATDPAVRSRARRRVAPRIALGAAIATVVAAAAVILPSVLGGDKAFATWTAVPTGLSAAESDEAARSCRDQQESGSPEYRDQLSAASTAISERRGEWTLVILAGRDGFSALCISDEPRPLFQSQFGSVGSTRPENLPGPRGLAATVLGTGGIDGNTMSIAAGHAGSDVTAVRYASSSRGKVTATVSGGQFALWIPGDEFESASRRNVPVQVSYRDGSTATVTLGLS
jgi:hypothetical protein